MRSFADLSLRVVPIRPRRSIQSSGGSMKQSLPSQKPQFGPVQPYRVYVARMRWLLAFLICLSALLFVALFLLASNNPRFLANEPLTPAVPSVAVASPAPLPPSTPEIEVLIARDRIEQGTKLHRGMFEPKLVAQNLLPQGVLMANEIDSVDVKYARTVIPANLIVVEDYLSSEKPNIPFEIPDGYRAVSITMDARSGVEGYVRPNSRVDVLWLYRDREDVPKIATIVRFARVLSVNGQTSVASLFGPGGGSPVGSELIATLLITEREAKMIELARETGRVSLSLVGDSDAQVSNTEEVVTVHDLVRSEKDSKATEERIQGTFSTRDPRTGKQVRLQLSKDDWKPTSEPAPQEASRGALAQMRNPAP